MAEIVTGSLGVSENAHLLLGQLVYDEKSEDFIDDRPFKSITEGFRFAFSLGYCKNIQKKREGKSMGIAPRQFVVDEYTEILREDVEKTGMSLGALVSDYAEAGCELMQKTIDNGDSILSLIGNNK